MSNPAPWSSFEHFGAFYVEHAKHRIRELNVPATYIQRWWRQRDKPKKMMYPIQRCKTVRGSASILKGVDPLLSSAFIAYEKLDGTNFGVRCDGARYGRRTLVSPESDSYQNVPLDGIVPNGTTVAAIKHTLLGGTGGNAKLILYGELMCNPGKFDYAERSMGKKFYCFGAMLDTERCESTLAQLIEKGIVACVSKKQKGRIRLSMNKTFADCVQQHGVSPVPMLGEGPLRELCFRMKDTLMKDGMEGTVLTCQRGMGLYKWKTSAEDESKTRNLLCSLIDNTSPILLRLAGVDIPFVQCFIEVAKKKEEVEPQCFNWGIKKKQTKIKAAAEEACYDEDIMNKAIASAMSKHDCLEAYFERGERIDIITTLNKEAIEDIGASSTKQIKCVRKHISKTVGLAFGEWKKKKDEAVLGEK